MPDNIPAEIKDAWKHADSVADTGHAYRQWSGWILTCEWCGHEVRSEGTKADAIEKMQEHYDTVMKAAPSYSRIIVQSRPVAR